MTQMSCSTITRKDVMITLEMTVSLTPVPKGRPRFTRQGRAYTPKKTADYEATIRKCAQEYMRIRALEPLETPVSLRIDFFMPIPQSLSKKVLEGQYHTKRPDLDNLMKAMDALNGIFWKDDSQIARLSGTKSYSKLPRIEIKVTEIV